MVDRPVINAEITFLTNEDGGRVQVPVMGIEAKYMPHIVIQSPDVRVAVVDDDRCIGEPYQGVRFIDGPMDVRLGESAECTLELMYYPNNRYTDVVEGATFTIREGGKIVGFGQVTARTDPDAT